MKNLVNSFSDLMGGIRPFWQDGWRIKRLCKKKEKSCYDITKVTLISPNGMLYNWEDILDTSYSDFNREELNSAHDLFYMVKAYFNSKVNSKRKYRTKT